MHTGDFLSDPVVKNLPSSAGDVGSIPDQGTKIPYAARKLSLHANCNKDPEQPKK